MGKEQRTKWDFFPTYIELKDLKLMEKMGALPIVKLVEECVQYHFTAIILQSVLFCIVFVQTRISMQGNLVKL